MHRPTVSERKTRNDPRLTSYVISSVSDSTDSEPPTDDDLCPEESLTGPIAGKDHTASSLAKGPVSMGQTKTSDRRRGHSNVAVCRHTSVHTAGVAGNTRIQWDVPEDEELRLSAAPRTTPKAIGAPSLRLCWPGCN